MVENSILIEPLSPEYLPEMYRAFSGAFKDYPVSFVLSEDHFKKKFVDKLNINFSLSAGAFRDGSILAFVFTSSGIYEGVSTAYNGGTGVIPKYRGNGLTYRLYDYLIPVFEKQGIKQCILEVLMSNKAAIKAYENIGFSISRNFKCYKLNPAAPSSTKENSNVVIRRVERPDWKNYTKFFDYIPCYLDSRAMIEKNLPNETVLEAEVNDEVAGYAIFQPTVGRISQLAVDRKFRGFGIASMLLRYIYRNSSNKALTIINVLEEAEGFQKFLLKSGFENEINQYEMRMLL